MDTLVSTIPFNQGQKSGMKGGLYVVPLLHIQMLS